MDAMDALEALDALNALDTLDAAQDVAHIGAPNEQEDPNPIGLEQEGSKFFYRLLLQLSEERGQRLGGIQQEADAPASTSDSKPETNYNKPKGFIVLSRSFPTKHKKRELVRETVIKELTAVSNDALNESTINCGIQFHDELKAKVGTWARSQLHLIASEAIAKCQILTADKQRYCKDTREVKKAFKDGEPSLEQLRLIHQVYVQTFEEEGKLDRIVYELQRALKIWYSNDTPSLNNKSDGAVKVSTLRSIVVEKCREMRHKFTEKQNSYHGVTLVISVVGGRKVRKKKGEGFVPHVNVKGWASEKHVEYSRKQNWVIPTPLVPPETKFVSGPFETSTKCTESQVASQKPPYVSDPSATSTRYSYPSATSTRLLDSQFESRKPHLGAMSSLAHRTMTAIPVAHENAMRSGAPPAGLRRSKIVTVATKAMEESSPKAEDSVPGARTTTGSHNRVRDVVSQRAQRIGLLSKKTSREEEQMKNILQESQRILGSNPNLPNPAAINHWYSSEHQEKRPFSYSPEGEALVVALADVKEAYEAQETNKRVRNLQHQLKFAQKEKKAAMAEVEQQRAEIQASNTKHAEQMTQELAKSRNKKKKPPTDKNKDKGRKSQPKKSELTDESANTDPYTNIVEIRTVEECKKKKGKFWLLCVEASHTPDKFPERENWLEARSVYGICQEFVDDGQEARNFVLQFIEETDSKAIPHKFASMIAKLAGSTPSALFPDCYQEFEGAPQDPGAKRSIGRALDKVACNTPDHDNITAYKEVTETYYFKECRRYSEAICRGCQNRFATGPNKKKKDYDDAKAIPLPKGNKKAYACEYFTTGACLCGNILCNDCYVAKLSNVSGTRKRRQAMQTTVAPKRAKGTA